MRESRIAFPLHVGQVDGTRRVVASRTDYLDMESFPLITDAREIELAGTEGELCETGTFSRDTRELFQQSCEADVYRNAYSFERIHGCWRLIGVQLGGS